MRSYSIHCTMLATLAVSACSGSDATDPVLPDTPTTDDKAAPPNLPPVEPGRKNRATVAPWSGQPCVEIPQRRGEVFRYGTSLSVPELKWTVKTETLIGMDLDGLGSPVIRVPELARLNGLREVTSLSWSLYIERPAGCVHLLGSYQGHSEPWLLATSHEGLGTSRHPGHGPFSRRSKRSGARPTTFTRLSPSTASVTSVAHPNCAERANC